MPSRGLRPGLNERKCLREKKLCDNCFYSGHIARSCMKSSNCTVDGCSRKHHTLVHPPNRAVDGNHVNQTGTKQENTGGTCNV